MQKSETILFCNCGYSEIIDHTIKAKILDALASSELNFEVVQDLCGLAVEKDCRLKGWAGADSLTVIGCYPRTVKWLFKMADAELDSEKTKFLNMRTSSAEEIIASLFGEKTPCGDKQEIGLEEKGGWVPWFPVIDYDRCKNCKQCLNFCLFGVYELSETEQVQVTNPAGCKTNCPACAKVCPHNAIIFPKYPDSPINGDDVDGSQVGGEKVKLDSGVIDGNDIYEMLKKRSKSGQRFEKGRAGLGEIDLTKLKDQLGIPLETLESLKPGEVIKLREKLESNGSE